MQKFATGPLSDFEKGQVVSLRRVKLSHSQIQAQVNRSKSSIQDILRRWEMRGDHKNISPPGKKPTLDTRARRYIVRKALENRRQSLCELRDNTAPLVSICIVQRVYKK